MNAVAPSLLADIRRLCGLGLPAPLFAAAVSPLMREAFGSPSTGFTRVGPDGHFDSAPLTDLPPPEEIVALYFSNPKLAIELEQSTCADLWSFINSGQTAQNSTDFPRDFFRSQLYEHIFIPQNIHHALRVALRQGGHAVGCLHMSRSPGERPYSQREEAFFISLAPWFSHALSRDAGTSTPECDTWVEEGTVIVDVAGSVRYRCATAQRLLYMLGHADGKPGATGRETLRRRLAALAANSLAAQLGRAVTPPNWRVATTWGEISLHASPLESETGSPSGLVVARVRRRVPRVVRVAGALAGNRRLTPRHKDICLAMAQGLSRSEIAARLGVRVSTVITHTRDLYSRLGAGNREDMLRIVLGDAPAP